MRILAALVVFCAGTAQFVLRQRLGAGATTFGLVAVVVGMGVIAASSVTTSLAVAIIGGVVAGSGAGAVQLKRHGAALVGGLLIVSRRGNRSLC